MFGYTIKPEAKHSLSKDKEIWIHNLVIYFIQLNHIAYKTKHPQKINWHSSIKPQRALKCFYIFHRIVENIRWRGHKWQVSVYINLFQKPQMNSVLTYHKGIEGLAFGICIWKYWEHTQESPHHTSLESVSSSDQCVSVVGKKPNKVYFSSHNNCWNLFLNMWRNVIRCILALWSPWHKSQQTCNHFHLHTQLLHICWTHYMDPWLFFPFSC